MILGVDFETASLLDVRSTGAVPYGLHPSTRLLCAVFRFSKEKGDALPAIRWLPGDALPDDVRRHIASGGAMLAHNSGFERAVWRVTGWPTPAPEQWFDTAANAAVFNLPLSLAGLSAALGAAPKDLEGRAHMLKFSRAREKNGEVVYPSMTPDDQKRLLDYCQQDVDTMIECWWRLPKMSPEVETEYRVDQRINDRGVFLDLPLARDMEACAHERDCEIAAQVLANTGLLGVTNVPELTRWLTERGVVLPKVPRKRADGTFHVSESVDRAAIAKILKQPNLAPEVRQVLLARVESGRMTSLAKASRAAEVTDNVGRLRGAFRFCKASTGRWASSGLQLHNLARPSKAFSTVAPQFIAAVQDRDIERAALFFPVLEGLSYMLRSLVAAPPGRELIGGDYSAIEARVVAWVAGQDNITELFRAYDATVGQPAAERRKFDVYVRAADDIGSTDRQLGKVATLGLGYGMGAIKFRDRAAQDGIILTLKEARQVQQRWRKANSAIVEFWRNVEDAFRDAVASPGTAIPVGPFITLQASKHVLRIKLPSGRCLHYWRPHTKQAVKKIETVTEDGEIVVREFETEEIRFFAPKGDTMVNESTYGGMLTENIVQAIARDIMAAALVRLDRTPYDICMHVHDSAAAEVVAGTGDVEEFCALMAEVPPWAPGLPLAVEGYRALRFKG